MLIKYYQTKTSLIVGSDYKTLVRKVRELFKELNKTTKRKPHIKSIYFKQKIFLDYFWQHLYQKSPKERTKRLKLFKCGTDLISNTHFSPTIKKNPNNNKEIFYRFYGKTRENKTFVVQIKESLPKSTKFLMSIFEFNTNTSEE